MNPLALLLALATLTSAIPAAFNDPSNTILHWETVDSGGATKRIGYRQFGLDVTEYCSGTSIRARAYWTDTDGSDGKNIEFGNGKEWSEINLGYNTALRIGPYDFVTHSPGLHYGGCDWDQDIKGVGERGLCDPEAWSGPDLECPNNEVDTRTRHVDCWVGVTELNDVASNSRVVPRYTSNPPTAVREAAAPSKTTIQPTVIIRPTDLLYRPVILPFHITLTQSCLALPPVTATYTNGLTTTFPVSPSTTANINHTITEYPGLVVGLYVSGNLRFGYKSPERKIECVWWTNESWRRCGSVGRRGGVDVGRRGRGGGRWSVRLLWGLGIWELSVWTKGVL